MSVVCVKRIERVKETLVNPYLGSSRVLLPLGIVEAI